MIKQNGEKKACSYQEKDQDTGHRRQINFLPKSPVNDEQSS